MGTITRMTTRLRDRYEFTEDEALARARVLSDLEIGDDIADAVYDITGGYSEEGFAKLTELAENLAAAVHLIRNLPWPLRRSG